MAGPNCGGESCICFALCVRRVDARSGSVWQRYQMMLRQTPTSCMLTWPLCFCQDVKGVWIHDNVSVSAGCSAMWWLLGVATETFKTYFHIRHQPLLGVSTHVTPCTLPGSSMNVAHSPSPRQWVPYSATPHKLPPRTRHVHSRLNHHRSAIWNGLLHSTHQKSSPIKVPPIQWMLPRGCSATHSPSGLNVQRSSSSSQTYSSLYRPSYF